MGGIQQADLCAQSGEHEKQRQKQHQRHIFDLLGHHPAETEVGRHDHSGKECTEQSMDTQNFGDIRRDNHHQKDKPDQCFADRLLPVITLPDLAHKRFDHAKHKGNVTGCQQNRHQCTGHISSTRHGNHRRQQAPGRHIVVGRTGNGQHSHRSLSQISFLYDTGQNGKCRNTDRDCDEKSERHK